MREASRGKATEATRRDPLLGGETPRLVGTSTGSDSSDRGEKSRVHTGHLACTQCLPREPTVQDQGRHKSLGGPRHQCLSTVTIQDKELWVIDRFVNSQWFRGKFQLKVRWEDQDEDQDDWRGYEDILREAALWQQELSVGDDPPEDQVRPMVEEYYLSCDIWGPRDTMTPHIDRQRHRATVPCDVSNCMRTLRPCWGVMK